MWLIPTYDTSAAFMLYSEAMEPLTDARKTLQQREKLATAKRWGKRGLITIVLVLVCVVGAGQALITYDNYRSPEVVARIHARAVTMDMVEGKNLPQMPTDAEKDSTVAGVDSNKNGVRDDVEIAIYERHPDSPKIRAAQLQYAMALQSQLTEVFSKTTLVAAIQESDRSLSCIDKIHKPDFSFITSKDPDSLTEVDFERGNKLHKEHDAIIEPFVQEIEKLVLNTSSRQFALQKSYDYMTGYSGSSKEADCDLWDE